MKERVDWIDGMKGYACIIVLMGHSVACIFPHMIFGGAYMTHSQVESFFHNTPLSLLYSSGQMNCLFFMLSGFLIAKKKITGCFVSRVILKYLKFIPMVLFGIFLSFIIMNSHLVFVHLLADYSYAANYVGGVNVFEASVRGDNSFIYDAFIRTFIDVSKYDSPLWFLTIVFWGSILTETIEKSFDSKHVKSAIYVMLYIAVMNLELVDWRIPYLGFVFAGVIVCTCSNKIKMGNVVSTILFITGLYILSTGDYIGFYLPLKVFSGLGLNLKAIGSIFIVLSVDQNDKLQRVFDTKIGKWLSKYSLAIYVIHWAIVISVSCGVTYVLHLRHQINYMIAGAIGIIAGLVITIIIAVLYTEDFYLPYYKNFLGKLKIVIGEKKIEGK